jgi:hypothetical protein
MNCEHNHRCRYTTGFFCEDCHTFFDKDSPTYRSGEYLSELWMACHNINARALQAHQPERKDALAMRDRIGIGLVHPDYEALIAEVEAFLTQNNTSPDSATLVLNRP